MLNNFIADYKILLAEIISPKNTPVLIKNKEVYVNTVNIFKIPYNTPFILSKTRKLAPKMIYAEFLTFLTTKLTKRIQFIEQFFKNMSQYATDFGNYGFRWRICFAIDQLQECINLLKQQKHSRRVVMHTYNSVLDLNEAAKDVPCNVMQQWYIDGYNRLHLYNICRSQDLWLGFPIDIIHFSWLYKIFYNTLKEIYTNLKYGYLYHIITLPHIYVIDIEKIRAFNREIDIELTEFNPPIVNMNLTEATAYANKIITDYTQDKLLNTKYKDYKQLTTDKQSQKLWEFYYNATTKNTK